MVNIVEVINDLNLGEFGNEFENYSNAYICDAITEIADNNVDIYTEDLLDWAGNNMYYIDKANEELGRPSTFLEEIQQGEYYYNETNLYENLNDIVKNYAFKYVINKDGLDTNEITEEQYAELSDELENIDSASHCNDIIDIVNDVLNEE